MYSNHITKELRTSQLQHITRSRNPERDPGTQQRMGRAANSRQRTGQSRMPAWDTSHSNTAEPSPFAHLSFPQFGVVNKRGNGIVRQRLIRSTRFTSGFLFTLCYGPIWHPLRRELQSVRVTPMKGTIFGWFNFFHVIASLQSLYTLTNVPQYAQRGCTDAEYQLSLLHCAFD